MEPIPAASFGHGFGKSHFMLIVVSALVLTAALFMRGGFTLGRFLPSTADADNSKVMTYAEALAQAEAELAREKAAGNPDEVEALTQDQLAQVDPNYGTGEVLGASVTEDGNINLDAVLNSGLMNSVKINVFQTEDWNALNNYAYQVSQTENRHGGMALMASLTTRDAGSLTASLQGYKKIIAELQALQVPAQFEEFHKMKLTYYSTLALMAESMASDGPSEQASTAASLFFSLNERIESLGTQLGNQYGVIL